MKKTLNIHLGKQLFTIEEDAFERLQSYLKRLELSFAEEEGRADILEDIEMRFAELLKEYMTPTQQVVTIAEVDKAIESLGEPENIREEDEPEKNYQSNTGSSSEYQQGPKRMYRNMDDAMLGGVASGLASYLNIDPVIARAVFVIFFFMGFGFFLYLILWVIIPSAKTPSERLQMRGKAVTVDTLKEEFEKAATRIKNDTTRAAQRLRSGNSHISEQARNLFRLVGRIIGIALILGSLMWLVAFSLVVTGLIEFIPMTGDHHYASLFEFLQLVAPAEQSFPLIWLGILVVGFGGPVFCLLIGFRMLTGSIHRAFKISSLALLVIVGIGIVFIVLGSVKSARDYAVPREYVNQEYQFSTDRLEIQELPEIIGNHQVLSSGGLDFITIEKGQIVEEGIIVSYLPSHDSLFHVKQIFSANGVDRNSAVQRCMHMQHKLQVINDKLLIDPYYRYPSKDGIRNQEVELIIEVPSEKELKINGFTVKNPEREYSGRFRPNREFIPYD